MELHRSYIYLGVYPSQSYFLIPTWTVLLGQKNFVILTREKLA